MRNEYKTVITYLLLIAGVLLFTNIYAQSEINLPDTTYKLHSDTTQITSDSLTIIHTPDSLNTNDTTSLQKANSLLALTDTSLILGDSATSYLDSLKVVYFEGSLENLKLNKFTYIDTNTYGVQNYDPLHKHNKMYATLSNIGEASRNIVFTPILSGGYYTDIETFAPYMYSNDQVKYYKLFVPYTELNYSLGSKREQNFNAIFTRKIFKGFTIGVNYALNFSPSNDSPYLRSGSNIQRMFATAQYYTPNKRYGLIANYITNKLIVEENGGITNDSIFENNEETDRRVIPVNLSDAENMIKKSGFFIEQYFNILSPRNKSGYKRKIDPGNISYSFKYTRNQFIFTDGDSSDRSFYFNHSAIIDSASTYDSLYQLKYVNTIKWSNIGYQEDPTARIFYIYLGVSLSSVSQMLPCDSIETNYSQTKSFGGVAFNFGKSFLLNADAYYITGNYNQGDYGLSGSLRQYLGNLNRNVGYLKFDMNIVSRAPNWYFNNYNSNYYRWSNNFDKENYLILSGSYNFKTISAGVKFTTVGNYTYMDDSIRPQQISKGETMLQIFAEGRIPIKKLGIDAKVVYQKTSQPNIIRVPDFTGTLNIYYRTPIFKKAGTIQTGFQITYFTDYYANAYMPELRLFYLQDEKKIGNYPYVDFYLTLMVKRARLFFKMSHLNSYLGDYNYYLTPHYPARDASFHFGVSWRFHD